MKKWTLTLLLFWIATPSFALEQDGRCWCGADVDNTFTIDSDWHYNLYTQMRFDLSESNLQQIFIRPSIYRVLNHSVSIWLGCDAIPTWLHSVSESVTESRIWPQFEYEKPISQSVELDLRTRYEFRWLSVSNQRADRFRQRVVFSINNIFSNAKFNVFDEIFFNIKQSDWTANSTVDQNRVFVGLGFALNPMLNLDCGYMNLFRPRSNINRMDHICVVGLGYNLGSRPQPYLTDV